MATSIVAILFTKNKNTQLFYRSTDKLVGEGRNVKKISVYYNCIANVQC